MSGVWGNKVKYSIFGESHGKGVGINIDGLPSGVKLDLEAITYEMRRRAPGRDDISTARSEKDEFQIISGYFNDRTTGTPLCAIIWNTDMHSKDYSELKTVIRPGHADYTGSVKYSGFNDYRGGGHFSGRITAPLVFAGAIAKQILNEKGIEIGGHIYHIAGIYDSPFDNVNINSELLKNTKQLKFPVLDQNKGLEMISAIHRAKENQDSVGGVVECAILNLPEGLGSPFFDSVESLLAHLLFSIPGVKGVEFGTGFDMANLSGSEANDEFYMDGNKVKTFTNNNGGILGGITNGMPMVFKAAFKPTASIGKIQKTIDISKMKDTEISVKGRHDPCIVQRALPVVEAVAAMVILDLL
ncbi:chorismate synthase [Clostridium sp.]|uniref:chorismate synthase n=1 Tax=Clostridium sp. TaxID=1506 RepID=UPI001A53A425|nr:chorismate synthase [Clostridium sp.]MBK5242856.1 chorismate synthase [Clostridium sp.]